MANRDWSPIASAPRDGTFVEARNDWGKEVLAHYDAELGRFVVELPDGGRYVATPGALQYWRTLGADDVGA
jgi:hypothetical protein